MLGFALPGPLKKLSKSVEIQEKTVNRNYQTSVLFSSRFFSEFHRFGAPSWPPFFLPNRSQEGIRAQGKHFLNDAMFFATQGVPQGEIFLDSGVDFHGFFVLSSGEFSDS